MRDSHAGYLVTIHNEDPLVWYLNVIRRFGLSHMGCQIEGYKSDILSLFVFVFLLERAIDFLCTQLEEARTTGQLGIDEQNSTQMIFIESCICCGLKQLQNFGNVRHSLHFSFVLFWCWHNFFFFKIFSKMCFHLLQCPGVPMASFYDTFWSGRFKFLKQRTKDIYIQAHSWSMKSSVYT